MKPWEDLQLKKYIHGEVYDDDEVCEPLFCKTNSKKGFDRRGRCQVRRKAPNNYGAQAYELLLVKWCREVVRVFGI